MISKKISQALAGSSAIRAMFVEGKAMAEKYGAQNVYDFSLGNPATPPPKALHDAIKELVAQAEQSASAGMELHGYMENAGYRKVREAIAENLNQRFQTNYGSHNVIMTVGAAGGLNIVLHTLLDPQDEVLVFAPFFGEYRQYAANFDASLVVAAPDYETFQPDLADLEEKITARTKALIVNTPNNPTGVVYEPDTLKKIAEILEKKQKQFGTDLYLISDEPYRELVYDGGGEDFLTKYYRNTIVAYSFSKSLSLPGERIGYVVVPDEAADSCRLLAGMEIANRTLGFVNAPSLLQKAVACCLEEKPDLAFYDENRRMLYEELTRLGFACIRPQGAFYLWVKAPVNEDDFVAEGKKQHILMVKGSAFGCPGYVRLAYCVSHETVKNSLPAFARLAEIYGLGGKNA
ncbi:MAG: pyridoxal phosphate-dependent aminotransferase [Roseburia sp.]